jgi:hypothetical protein
MTRILSPYRLPDDRLLRPLAAHHVVGGAVEEVHRDRVEQLRRPALQEQDVVRVGDREQRLALRDRLVQDAVELLAPVRALGDAETLALIVDEGLGGRFQDLGRQHGRPCAEVEYAVAHAALLPPAAPEFKRLSRPSGRAQDVQTRGVRRGRIHAQIA